MSSPRPALATLLVLLSACGGPPLQGREPAIDRWEYVFSVDAGLTRLRATVCFDGPMPRSLRPIDSDGRRYLRIARGPNGLPLEREAGRLLTGALRPGSCVHYEVDLEAAARQHGGIHGAYRIGEDLIASTAIWLWTPTHRAPGSRARARFELPEGIRVSPLWPQDADGTYVLDERAFRFIAYAAFGRFETRPVPVAGGCLHLTILGEGVQMGPDALTRSLSRGASAASMLMGRFPKRQAGLLVVPTPFSTSSPFGLVGRGTMPTIAILVGERATEERLTRAWVPVHEFSHLAVPFIARRDAWLSEGLATYYQEVLRARGGLLSPEEAWTNLVDGFRRGQHDGTGRTLAEESRDMRATAAYRRVYWAGAAIALMADVEMRTRSGGRRSLDEGIRRLHECCARKMAPLSAEEAMHHIDRGGPPIFSSIARRMLGSRDFPDLSSTFEALGITLNAEGITLDGETHALRDAIMSPRPLALAPSTCGLASATQDR